MDFFNALMELDRWRTKGKQPSEDAIGTAMTALLFCMGMEDMKVSDEVKERLKIFDAIKKDSESNNRHL